MIHIIFVLSLCFRFGELLTFWIQVNPFEVALSSQLLQVFFVLFAIYALLCQNALTVSPIAGALLRLSSLLSLLFGEFGFWLAQAFLQEVVIVVVIVSDDALTIAHIPLMISLSSYRPLCFWNICHNMPY